MHRWCVPCVFIYGIGPRRCQEDKGVKVPESTKEMCSGFTCVFPKKYSTYHFLKPSPMEDEKMEEVMPVDDQPTTSKEFC
jgi:hypothetical protein